MMPTWSRACPPCLRRDGVWPLWWRPGIAAVCPVHRCLLVDVCPRCGVLLRGSERVPRGLLTREPLPAVGECANRPPRGPKGRAGLCRQVLADIPAPAVPAAWADLQRRVLAVAEGAPVRIQSDAVSGADCFQPVPELARSVVYHLLWHHELVFDPTRRCATTRWYAPPAVRGKA
ncbi:hypothetical protein [Streptomyces sp. NPDC047869]|uniref:hypothetical protein n=1 Tax=Streptomyces sp. NPDC047869 TaxID=3154709 RepID=UPI003451A6DD